MLTTYESSPLMTLVSDPFFGAHLDAEVMDITSSDGNVLLDLIDVEEVLKII